MPRLFALLLLLPGSLIAGIARIAALWCLYRIYLSRLLLIFKNTLEYGALLMLFLRKTRSAQMPEGGYSCYSGYSCNQPQLWIHVDDHRTLRILFAPDMIKVRQQLQCLVAIHLLPDGSGAVLEYHVGPDSPIL